MRSLRVLQPDAIESAVSYDETNGYPYIVTASARVRLAKFSEVGVGSVPTTRAVNTTAPLSGGGALSADLTLAIVKATASVDGYLAATDFTTFNNKASTVYVDSVAQGLDLKLSCRVATTANITLSGTQTIDGVAVIAGDRVLVKDQSTGANNGIYVCAVGAWARSTDADTSAEVTAGMFTFIEEGTANADSGWVLTTNATITLGSTSLMFTQFSGAGQITAGSGLGKSGNTLSIASYPALNGSAITGLNGSNVASGTVAAARLPSSVTYTNAANVFTANQEIDSANYDAALIVSQTGFSDKASFGGLATSDGGVATMAANGYIDSGGGLAQFNAANPTWVVQVDARGSQDNVSLVRKFSGTTNVPFKVGATGTVTTFPAASILWGDSFHAIQSTGDGSKGGTANNMYLKEWDCNIHFQNTNGGTDTMLLSSANVAIGTTDFGAGAKVFAIGNATTPPGSTPSGGGVLYAQSGAGKWKGSSGTVTTFGPADPHCPVCNSDFGAEWVNPKYGRMRICWKCFFDEFGSRPYVRVIPPAAPELLQLIGDQE